MDKALIRAEWSTVIPKSVQSISTSASRKSHKGAFKKRVFALRDRAALKQELGSLQTLSEVASAVFFFFDAEWGELIYQYVFKLFLTQRFVLKCQIRWEPNETGLSSASIGDWGHRCYQNKTLHRVWEFRSQSSPRSGLCYYIEFEQKRQWKGFVRCLWCFHSILPILLLTQRYTLFMEWIKCQTFYCK